MNAFNDDSLFISGGAKNGCFKDVSFAWSRYTSGEVDADTAAAVEQHLRTCKPCRVAWDDRTSDLEKEIAAEILGTTPERVEELYYEDLWEQGGEATE